MSPPASPGASLASLFALDGDGSSPSDASALSFSALLFSEDLEASLASLEASPSAVDAADAKVAREKALAVKRRRAHRQRVKSQAQHLKSQLVELSAELQRLRGVRGEAGLAHASRVRIWRSMAARQKEARTAAVAQNRKLRAQVLHRQTQLRGLFNALERRPLLSDGPATTFKDDSKRPVMEPSDSPLFEAFLDELDTAYAQTDDVMRTSGVAGLPEQSRSQKVSRKWDADRGSTVFELVDARVLPFSFVQTRSVLWQSIVRVHCRYPQEVYSRAEDPDNTIAVKCHVDCHVRSKNETAPLVVYLVLRRYTEADRTVLVWRALSEGRGSLSGLYSDETGWTVLRPKTGSSAVGDGATTMETCTRFEPICSAPSGFKGASGSGDADLFTTLLVSTVDQDNQDITHLMADLILKDLLGAHLSSVDLSTDAGFSK